MKFNWKTPLTALGGIGAAVGMLALARTPIAANPGVMYAAAAVTSQFATAFGFIGSRFDQLRERERVGNRNEIASNPSHSHERADRDDPDTDTEASSGAIGPTRLPEALDRQLGEDLEKMVHANKRGDHAEVEALAERAGRTMALAKQTEDIDRMVQADKRGDKGEVAALLESVRQSAAEFRMPEATPDLAEPSRETASRGSASPEAARQETQPESEQAGGSDVAARAPDDRAATTSRIGQASETDASGAESLASTALEAARAQRRAVPGEQMAAQLARELAVEAAAVRERIARLDHDLQELLERHPDAALIRSLPGMGAVLTAEFIAEAGNLSRFRSADALAAAAGLAPVLRQSGKVRFLRRPAGGNKSLKWILYQSAFCSLKTPASSAFYARKRKEGKRHHQAVLALARRRVNVLWAMLHHRQLFQLQPARAS